MTVLTVEQRLRAALERYGRHEPGCPAVEKLFTGRCRCGLHRALADFDSAVLDDFQAGQPKEADNG